MSSDDPVNFVFERVKTTKTKGLANLANPFVLTGRSETIRTFDPLLPRQVRYQAALRSVNFYLYSKSGSFGKLIF